MLQDISDGYLNWMIQNLQEVRHSEGWVQLSKAELAYRKTAGIEISQKDSDSKDPKKNSGNQQASNSKTQRGELVISPKAIDAASLLMLDKYLAIKGEWEEPLGIHSWLFQVVDHFLKEGNYTDLGNCQFRFKFKDTEYTDLTWLIYSPDNSTKLGIFVADIRKGTLPASGIENLF